MRKPALYALRALCTAEMLIALVFTPTLKGAKSLLLWLALWLMVETVNALRARKHSKKAAAH